MSDKKKLTATFKSQDTEEWLDIHFTRPLGLLWANFFNAFNIHPNVVTILSIFLGLGAGIMFCFEDLAYNIIGILLLIWANLYDSCDGQLARMTGKKTRWGRILDGFAGDVWFLRYISPSAGDLRRNGEYGSGYFAPLPALYVTESNASWQTTTEISTSISSKAKRAVSWTTAAN